MAREVGLKEGLAKDHARRIAEGCAEGIKTGID